MASLSDRVRSSEFRRKITDAATAARYIRDGMTVSMSGFTPSGYPKKVPVALADRVKKTREPCRIFLLTGASVGEEIDGELSRLGVIAKRTPYQTNDELRRRINSGDSLFFDTHLGEVDGHIRRGFYGKIDIAVIEATAITEEGYIVPSTSVGNAPTALKAAEKVIIEVNTAQPAELEGFHDIYILEDPPKRTPVPLVRPGDRIGSPYMCVDPGKVCAVVLTDQKDSPRPLAEPDDACTAIADHLLDFLEHEVDKGRLPKNLLPLQSGVGNVANSVLKGFLESSFTDLSFYSEVIQDGAIDLIDAGKIAVASGTALTLSPARLDDVLSNLSRYKGRIVLRPQEISNCGEIISRLGVIAINTAVEADIYGNVNSSHILGSKLMNGLGGSGDFARNAYLSIFCTPSAKGNGRISSIVPMVSHIDHTEHDVDIIVTEQGIADLRGLSPVERAETIIQKCAHPDFKGPLTEYLANARRSGGHIPIDLATALSWHVNYITKGKMLPD